MGRRRFVEGPAQLGLELLAAYVGVGHDVEVFEELAGSIPGACGVRLELEMIIFVLLFILLHF